MKVRTQKEALNLLKEGFPLGFHTDTVPAIGCIPAHSEIIYKIKKREKKKALILMGAEISQVLQYVHTSALSDFRKLADEYWPGALTLIVPLPAQKNFKFLPNNFIGIRIPDSSTARLLISDSGPLATSSANISGISTSLTAHQISLDLPNLNLLGPVPWQKCSGKASTIIQWVCEGEWKLIRQGNIILSGLS
tara:strand:- start:354 stop:932 length:579 start_codon:yes stop_codon:yes gene_type:complete